MKISLSQPHRLLVRLCSETTATAILQNAPSLRQSQSQQVSQNIFINPELSPAAAKLTFEARRLRQERKKVQSTATTLIAGDQTVAAVVNATVNRTGVAATVLLAGAATSH